MWQAWKKCRVNYREHYPVLPGGMFGQERCRQLDLSEDAVKQRPLLAGRKLLQKNDEPS